MNIWELCKDYTISRIRNYTLTEKLFLEQWIIPAGITIKMFESKNFGWIILPKDTKDLAGHIIPKQIFKY